VTPLISFAHRILVGLTPRAAAIAVVMILLGAVSPVAAQETGNGFDKATQQLFQAVEINDLKRVKASLEAGADLNAKNAGKQTAADVAVAKGHFIIAHYLLSERTTRRRSEPKVAETKPIRLTPESILEAIKAPPKKKVTTSQVAPSFAAPPTKPLAPLPPDAEVAVALPPGGASTGGDMDADKTADLTPPVSEQPPGSADQPKAMAEPVPEPEAKEQGRMAKVGSFFRKLVDLVVPDQLERLVGGKTKTAAVQAPTGQPVETAPEPEATTEASPLPEPEPTMPEPTQDMAEEVVSEDMEEIVVQVEDAPPSTTTSRTMDRLSNLLSDQPLEDEYGLPISEDPMAPSSTDVAQMPPAEDGMMPEVPADDGFESVVEEPGMAPPDAMEESVEVIDTSRSRDPLVVPAGQDLALPRPKTTRDRLRLLREAITREIVINPDAILKESRRAGAERLAAEESYGKRLKRPTGDAEKKRVKKQNLVKRTDPAERLMDRMANRVDRLRKQDYENEDEHGLPRVLSEPEKPSSAVERMALFFTGAKEAKEKKQEQGYLPQREIAGDYQAAASTPQGVDDTTTDARPEIEIRKQFEIDEKETGQKRGKLTAGFLEKLALFFEEDEEKTAMRGWMAQVEVMDPGNAPDKFGVRPDPIPAEEVPVVVADPWTTTVEKSAGEGEAPVVVEVIETPSVPQDSLGENVAEVPADGASPFGEGINVFDEGEAADQEVVQAYQDPLREPDPPLSEEDQKQQFAGHLTQLFQPDPRPEQQPESLLLEPDEVLATTREMQPQSGRHVAANQPKQEAPTHWPITDVSKIDEPMMQPAKPNLAVLRRTSLSDEILNLGESVSLENIFPPEGDGADAHNECVKKNRGTTLFCIEPVDWPDDLKPSFVVPTILYTGTMAIVRFDQGEASRMHALFPSGEYDQVVGYYEGRYGEPTEFWKRSIAPLAEPRRDNPTVTWRSRDSSTNAISVLEIRQYDDSRGGFPDTKRGAVMLYLANSPAIFPQVSSHELMRLKRDQPEPAVASDDAMEAMPGMEGMEGMPVEDSGPGVSPDELEMDLPPEEPS